MSYSTENDMIFHNFLENKFYSDWKIVNTDKKTRLVLLSNSPYMYECGYKKTHESEENLKDNLNSIFEFLSSGNMNPDIEYATSDAFSKDSLMEDIYRQFMDLKDYLKPKNIIVPASKESENQKNYADKFDKIGIKLNIEARCSHSVCPYKEAMLIKLSDLSITVCPRLPKAFNIGCYETYCGKIIKERAQNLPFMFSAFSAGKSTQPFCECCKINNACNLNCIYSQYNATGDPFTPGLGRCIKMYSNIKDSQK